MTIAEIINKLARQCDASPVLLESLADALGITDDTRGAEEALFLAYCRVGAVIDGVQDMLAEANWRSPQHLVTTMGIAWHYGISRQNVDYILRKNNVRPVSRTSHRQGRQAPMYRVADIRPVFENWNATRDTRGRKMENK